MTMALEVAEEFQVKPVDAGDRLSFTVFVAIALHALIILGVNFKSPPASKGSQTTPASSDNRILPSRKS